MVYIASDHAGFYLKKQLVQYLGVKGIEVEDMGPDKLDSEDDFVDFASLVAKKVALRQAQGKLGRGILVCGTGQGMALAANKLKGIRAYVAWDEYTARHARENGDANIITLGAKTVSDVMAKKIVTIFLETDFLDREKYQRRIKKVASLENED